MKFKLALIALAFGTTAIAAENPSYHLLDSNGFGFAAILVGDAWKHVS